MGGLSLMTAAPHDARPGTKAIASNRKAFHEYFILDTIEAGIVLSGTEVKSLRANGCSLVDGFVRIKDSEGWLLNVHIPPNCQARFFYRPGPRRDIKLLWHAA